MTSITDKYMFILLPEGEMVDRTTGALKVMDTVLPGSTIVHSPTVAATGTTALVNGRLLAGGASATTRVGGGVRIL